MQQPVSERDSPEGVGFERFLLAWRAPGYPWLWGSSLFTWMAFTVENLGHGWLVLQLTDSPFWVGAAAGVRGVSQLGFSLLSGTLVDRVDRRKLLMVMQGVGGLTAAGLGVLVVTGAIQLWHILAMGVIGGVVGATNFPTQAALTYDVVGPARILNASALRFIGGSVMRIVGALAGGYIIAAVGVGNNYLVAGGAYAGAMVVLFFLKIPHPQRRAREPFARAVRAGLRYATRTPQVRRLLLLSLVTEAFGFSYLHMMPVMARDVLHVDARGLGYLTAMGGVGSVVAMTALASLGDFKHKGWLLVASTAGFGAAIIGFSFSTWFPLSLGLVAVVAGLSNMYDSTISTVIQLTVPEEMRGRVLGLYVSTFGTNLMGGFLSGSVASLIGAPVALAIGGGIVAVNGLRHGKVMGRFGKGNL